VLARFSWTSSPGTGRVNISQGGVILGAALYELTATKEDVCGTVVLWFGELPIGSSAFGLSGSRTCRGSGMRKDVREFIRRLEAVGLTVEPTPGHYRVLRDGKPLRKANGMPFMLPFSPDTTRWRRAATVELRRLGIDL